MLSLASPHPINSVIFEAVLVSKRSFYLLATVTATGAALAGTLAARWDFSPPPPTPATVKDKSLTIRLDGGSAQSELDTVSAGSRTGIAITLLNTLPRAIQVQSVQSSCMCLDMKIPERGIASGEKVEAQLVLDLSKEPSYRGNLLLDLSGFSPEADRLFTIRLSVSVR
jgi:hypothetical protein